MTHPGNDIALMPGKAFMVEEKQYQQHLKVARDMHEVRTHRSR